MILQFEYTYIINAIKSAFPKFRLIDQYEYPSTNWDNQIYCVVMELEEKSQNNGFTKFQNIKTLSWAKTQCRNVVPLSGIRKMITTVSRTVEEKIILFFIWLFSKVTILNDLFLNLRLNLYFYNIWFYKIKHNIMIFR